MRGGGGGENVIPVYEGSYCFQGHLAQGYDRYFAEGHRHYIFVADDLMLNPMINEGNYREHFGLDGDGAKSFLPECSLLHEGNYVEHSRRVVTWGNELQAGDLLPTYDETLKRFENLGLTIKPIPTWHLHASRRLMHWSAQPLRWRDITNVRSTLLPSGARFLVACLKRLHRTYFVPRLPFIYGYSDICIVSSKHIRQFVHYCRVLAAGNLFVEIALPTSLMMCAEPGEIITQENISLQGKPLWEPEEKRWLAEQYGMRLGKLLTDWPEGVLYIHPVKLSQWSQ